jgi:hypothetical protein
VDARRCRALALGDSSRQHQNRLMMRAWHD